MCARVRTRAVLQEQQQQLEQHAACSPHEHKTQSTKQRMCVSVPAQQPRALRAGCGEARNQSSAGASPSSSTQTANKTEKLPAGVSRVYSLCAAQRNQCNPRRSADTKTGAHCQCTDRAHCRFAEVVHSSHVVIVRARCAQMRSVIARPMTYDLCLDAVL